MLTPEQIKHLNAFVSGPLDSYTIHNGQLAVRTLVEEYHKTLKEFEKYKQTEQARFHTNALIPTTWEWKALRDAREAGREQVRQHCVAADHATSRQFGIDHPIPGTYRAVANQIVTWQEEET